MIFSNEGWRHYLLMGALALICVWITHTMTRGRIPKKPVQILCSVGFALYAALLILLFGCSVRTIQGMAFAMILLYASVQDARIRMVGDFVSVEILLLGLAIAPLASIPARIFLAILSALPVFLVEKLVPGDLIGGADVKITAASIFLIGNLYGFAGYLIGLILGVVFQLIFRRKRTGSFPLVPYLSIGFLAAFCL